MPSIYTKNVTIANAASASDSAQLCDTYNQAVDSLVGVITPAGFTTADITFQFSLDNSTFITAKNAAGSSITLSSVAASEWRAVDPTDFLGAKYIKLATSVAQTGGDIITLVIRGVA